METTLSNGVRDDGAPMLLRVHKDGSVRLHNDDIEEIVDLLIIKLKKVLDTGQQDKV